jgi:hypothetical protein
VTAHCKKRLQIFPSPAGMSLAKLSLAGIKLIFPDQESLFSDTSAGDGKIANLNFTVYNGVVLEERKFGHFCDTFPICWGGGGGGAGAEKML